MRIRFSAAVLRMYNDQSNKYHIPVLLEESIEALDIKSNGTYIDATFGGGGHSRPILNRLTAKGRLFGFDQDKQAQVNILDDPRFTFVNANFQYVAHFMRYYEVGEIDGVLADLGVSSFHFDEPSRGFSYRFDTELDMRMNRSGGQTARDVLATYDRSKLQQVFSQYGEVRNAKTLSQLIVDSRKNEAIERVGQLKYLIDRVYRGDKLKYMSQVFQALRIEVNDEMGTLKVFLDRSWDLLKSGGRIVVITYHSIEDKVVKDHFKRIEMEGIDEFGRTVKRLRQITKKPVLPTAEEIKRNSRASSAKLRVIEKI